MIRAGECPFCLNGAFSETAERPSFDFKTTKMIPVRSFECKEHLDTCPFRPLELGGAPRELELCLACENVIGTDFVPETDENHITVSIERVRCPMTTGLTDEEITAVKLERSRLGMRKLR